MPIQLSVRWRLLLAFLGISAFAVLAAATGTYAFRQMTNVLERITEQRVPSALAALDLSRQAERIVAAAPTLLTRAPRRNTGRSPPPSRRRSNVSRCSARPDPRSAVDPAAVAAMEPAVDGIAPQPHGARRSGGGRLEVSARKDALLRRLSNATVAAQRLVAPAIVVMDSKFAASRRAASSGPAAGVPRNHPSVIVQEIAAIFRCRRRSSSSRRSATACSRLLWPRSPAMTCQ